MSMKENHIGVASKSAVKVEATQTAVPELSVLAYDSTSGINDQPIGEAEILKGATQRIESAQVNGATGILIAIENGIIQVPNIEGDGTHWEDIAIILADYQGIRVQVNSEGVTVPDEIVNAVLAIGPERATIGKVLAQSHPEVDHQDPHSFWSNGKTSRKQILVAAISQAYNQLMQEVTQEK